MILRNNRHGTKPFVFHAPGKSKLNPLWKYLKYVVSDSFPNDLSVITWNSTGTEGSLERSLGGRCTVLGQGITRWQNCCKIGLTKTFLDRCETNYVLGMDSLDVTCSTVDLNRLIEALNNHGMICNAERVFWPSIPELQTYEYALSVANKASLWRYLNSGVWFGEREACRLFFNRCFALKDKLKHDGSDQFVFHHAFKEMSDVVALDYECKVFQTVHHCEFVDGDLSFFLMD